MSAPGDVGTDVDAPLPQHPPGTYVAVGALFAVAAIAAAIFGYVALSADAGDPADTGNPVADSALDGASGVLTRETGWLAMGLSLLAAAVSIVCFWRAARS